MSGLQGDHLIGYALSAEGARSLRAVDPSSLQELAPAFPEATSDEIDRALRLAQDAFDSFQRAPAATRAQFLEGVAAALREGAAAIVERAQRETALPEGRLTGELGRTCGQLELFARLVREGSWVDARIDRGDAGRAPVPKPDVRRILRPIGPVVVFGASNFPLAFSVAGGDTASAFAAGCPVVVKAHPAHPGTSELVGRAIVEVARQMALPEGVFSLLHGAGHDVGRLLTLHPHTSAVAFTGSFRGGRALLDAAASRDVPIPVFAEMGSTNPVFVLPDALAVRSDEIAAGLYASFTLGVGQFCTNPGLVVVPKGPAGDGLRTELVARVRASVPGTMLTAHIRAAYDDGVERLQAQSGVAELARGAAPAQGSADATAAVLEVEADRFLANPVLAEEVFGPVTVIVRTRDRDQMLEVARSLHGHLTATVQAEPHELVAHRDLVDVLTTKAGRVLANGFPTGVEVTSAMQHGGPYPATTDARFTSVGTAAALRFVRPVAFQDFVEDALPAELRDANPLRLMRLVDGAPTRDAIVR